MNKMFEQIIKLLLINGQRLSFLVALMILFPLSMYAGGNKDYYSAVKVEITGQGKVYVTAPSKSETSLTSTGVVTGKKNEAWGATGSDPGQSTHSYSMRVEEMGNYYYDKMVDGSTNITNISHSFTVTTKSVDEASAKASPNKTIKAFFKPYISIADKISFIVYDNGIDVVQFDVKDIYKRESLTFTLKGDDASKFKLGKTDGNINLSTLTLGAEDGLSSSNTTNASVYLDYSDGEYNAANALAVGENTYLEIKDNENHTWQVPIRTTAPESYTFLAGEGGKYTVVFANSDETTIKDIATDQGPTYLRSDMYTIASLTATANSGYKFFGWQTVDESEVGSYFSYNATTQNQTFPGGTKIRPVFIPNDKATFYIKEDLAQTPYFDLQEALDVASNTIGYSIVTFNAPTKGTVGTLYPRKDANNNIIPYNIPSGVTLLIPGDAAMTCNKGELTTSDVAASKVTAAPVCYSKLTLAEGTLLDVKGTLYLYSYVRHDNLAGQPVTYGQIYMERNSMITLSNENANLYAYGYITGDFSVSEDFDIEDETICNEAPQVIANKGVVHEILQFTDWRGGNASFALYSNASDKKVFPVSQYYIQNIEVPLTIKQGATEKVFSVVEASSTISAGSTVLVVPGASGGMFCASESTDVIKFYDASTDRLKIIARGTSATSKAYFGSISMKFTMIITLTVNSSDYVLPFNHNIDIILDNVAFTGSTDVCMLAGSSLKINDNATLTINSKKRLFIYDSDENKVTIDGKEVGYFGMTNTQFSPITYTPSNPSVASKRKSVEDTKILLNGTIIVKDGGAVCTTKGGANITSDGAGLFKDENDAAYTSSMLTTYQAYQVGNEISSYPEIPTTPAKLRNSDGSYVETSKVYPGTYTYYITNPSTKAGVWSLPPAKVTEPWSGTTVTATMPNQVYLMTITCPVENVTADNLKTAFTGSLDGTGFTFAGTDGKFENSIELINGNTLSIKVNYTSQNNTSTQHTAKLTLINATVPTAEYTLSTTLTATEEYKPEFEITQTEVTLPKTNPGTPSSKPDAFTIIPTSGTVATLTKAEGLTWSYTLDAPFGYKGIVDGIIDNENNDVTFNAATPGTHTKTLTITATYKPANGGDPVSASKEVTLIGTSLTPNTLAFDMPDEIKVTDKNVRVKFTGQNNTSDIAVTIDNTSVAELVKNPDGSYVINARSAGTFTLTATQEDAGTFAGTTTTHSITVKKLTPSPVWNWGVVYGNQSYTLPFDPTTVENGYWTLVKQEDSKNLLDYNPTANTLKVHNIQTPSTASFVFNQTESHNYSALENKIYNVTINRDPRILPMAITSETEFDIIEYSKTAGVVCNSNQISIPADGELILEFEGIPGVISFNTTANLSSLQLSESVDAQADSWKALTQVDAYAQWAFQIYSPSKFVKISNTSSTTVHLLDLQISLYEASRNIYYAMVSATTYPENVGSVAALGGYMSLVANIEEASVFAPDYEDLVYASESDGYFHMAQGFDAGSMPFYLYAKSNVDGYYFSNWSLVDYTPTNTELVWAGKNQNYQLPIIVSNVSDMYIGYPFGIYQQVYRTLNPEVYAAAKPEIGTPNPEAVAMMNAGTLALIPATHMGTWQANFALAEVVSTEDVTYDEVTSPNPADLATAEVVFNVRGDDTDDFVPSLDADNGFSFKEGDIALSTTHNTYVVNVTYTPQDIHGKHTANFILARATVDGQPAQFQKAKLTVEENLTPYFQLSNTDFGTGTLGQETIIDILPTDKNTVAQLLNPSKLHWEASLSTGAPFEIVSIAEDGTCKVRYFRTESGEKSATLTVKATYTDSKGTPISFPTTCTLTGISTAEKAANTLEFLQDIVLYVDDAAISPFSVNDPNNTAPITINLPVECTALVKEDGMLKPSGDFTTGTYTITASQAENDYFQASTTLTTTVTVKKHNPEVTWNLNQLYFGQTYDAPITTKSDGALTITSSGAGASIVHFDTSARTINVDPLTEGEYNVTFTVSLAESNYYEAFTNTYSAIIYKDPRHLRVDVNSDAVYQAVTVTDASQTGANVSYSLGAIRFADIAGSEYSSRQWTMFFIGVPDQLVFTPTGNNAWQIQESPNGSNWKTTYASAQIPAGTQFSMSLRPNTRYIRISYASNADAPSNGALSNMYITPLEGVKSNVDGMYLAIAADPVNHPTTNYLRLQYTASDDLTVYTSDPQFLVSVTSLPAVASGEYGDQTIVVTSKATIEKEGRLFVKNKSDEILLELPIQSFVYPQKLPVQLATDNAQRFHYLLATETSNVKWDMDTRTIIMQNAPANSDRSFTFAFEGAPSIIRFNHTAIAGRGTWTIRESANNADWYGTDPTTRVVNGNELEQGLLNTTRYVKVEYTSPYSEAVNINDLIIVGNASVTTDVTKLEFTDQVPTQLLTVTAINLADFDVMIDNANFTATFDNSSLTATGIVDIPVSITWTPNAAIDNATLTIVNPNDGNAVLATVELLGSKAAISDPANTGIYTGIAQEIKLNGSFEGYKRRPVDLTNAFDAATGTKALFDYLYVYGETSTMDGTSVITTPTTQRGSNAKTPCYIYQRVGDTYQLVKVVENVNSSDKAISGAITVPVQQPGVSTRIYITGFAPYASTGYTKEEEGVWLFRGEAGSKLDIYLEDCYIYSRYKTIDGHSFLNRNNGESFAESYARGSGGVLVFECSSLNNKTNPFDVTIHTCDSSLLKSHYGCFMASIVGRAYQVSSPVQIHLMSSDITTTTHLSFDDIWPTAITRTTTAGVVTEETLTTTRTNGFLSLQKQVNNAPSIDLGSPNTVVNFNGGQVELQNAQNVSDNYKTTLAISFRGGKFATFFLAYGVGSDEVSGTVNFNDGTTTVKPMTVDAKYRQYYLMDTDEHGNQLTTTSCLRCPKNTYIYGGSHSMMRACGDPTSQGGAPLNRPDGDPLGLYKFPKYPETGKKGGWTDGVNGLVNIVTADIDPYNYQVPIGYNVASVTPNTNGTDTDADDYLNFWFDPSFEPSAQPEVDKTISYWKTCMTEISAEYAGQGGSAGGDVTVAFSGDNQTELVMNLLYCKLDQNILDEINRDGYKAPVKSPSSELGAYLEIPPSSVGDDVQHFVNSTKSYRVENRVYYITTATADVWNAFTAPFDVQNIYIAETYPEEELEKIAAQQLKQGNNARNHILQLQAKHNANFAAFFAVTVALGKEKTFNEIYSEYLEWAKLQDQSTGLYTSGAYDLRGIHKLDPYMPGNWDANCYIYENNGNWVIDPTDEEKFTTQWIAVDTTDHKIMEKGKTYSMLLPYCTKCEPSLSDRDYWDYWSGKFLIFESTDTPEGGHIIDGTSALNIDNLDPYELGLQKGEAVIKGNTTLANVSTTNDLLYTFTADMQHSTFLPIDFAYDDDENLIPAQLLPTESFLVLDYEAPMGMYIKGVRHTGQLIFGTRDNTTTGNGNMPTISGNSDMLVTTTTTGINIAVATPQFVRVYTTNGSVIYAGMVNDNINIPLNSTGIYMVAGENTVQKIMLNR